MKKSCISLLALISLGSFAQSAQNSAPGSWFNFFRKSVTIAQVPAPLKPKIAVITLVEDFDISQAMFQLTVAAKDKDIAGISLIIDCNGGSAAHFSALHDLIKKVCLKKPVVGLVIGSALSAGYLIASATHYIIAQSVSNIGSIGAIAEIHKYKEPKITGNIDAKLEVELFHAGEYKAIYHPYQNLTEQERAYLQADIQKSYETFLKLVSQNRKLDLNTYKTWAEGKCHLAADALQMGLIDEIGTIFEAESKLIEMLRVRNPDLIYDNEVEFLYNPAKENNYPNQA